MPWERPYRNAERERDRHYDALCRAEEDAWGLVMRACREEWAIHMTKAAISDYMRASGARIRYFNRWYAIREKP